MAERKKRSSREEGHKKASRRLSANSLTPIVHSEKGKLRIGNYILGTTLGNGTFGKVKRKQVHDIHIVYFRLLLSL